MHRILKRAEEQSTQEEETFDRMKNEPEEWTEEDEFFERLAETEMDLNGNSCTPPFSYIKNLNWISFPSQFKTASSAT